MERRPRTSPGLLPGSAIFEALHFVWLVSACGTLKSRKWNIGTRNSKYPFVVLIIKVMFWLQNTSKTDRTASGNPSRTRNLRGMRNQLRSAFLLLSPRYFWSRRCIEPIAWNWAHDPANGWDSSTFDILIPISLKSLSARTVVAFEIVWSWSVNGIFRTVKVPESEIEFPDRKWWIVYLQEDSNCRLKSTPNVHTSKQTTAVSCQRPAYQPTGEIARGPQWTAAARS